MAGGRRALETVLVPALEALYRVERDERDWARDFTDALRPAFGNGWIGVSAGIVELDGKGGFRERFTVHDVPASLTTRVMDTLRNAPPEHIERMAKTPFLVSSDWPLWHAFYACPNEWNFADGMVLNAGDTNGITFTANIFLDCRLELEPALRTAMTRISAHMIAAHRLRTRLQRRGLLDGAAAVLDPEGRVHHANGAARSKAAREALARATAAIERARGPLRRSDPQEAVEIWRAMVRADWTLADFTDTDHKRFVVARENSPSTRPIPELTRRETQVVAFANLGHHNKLIAYELGIAASTVRVLLTRAAAKLGASSRAELLRAANQKLAAVQARADAVEQTTEG